MEMDYVEYDKKRMENLVKKDLYLNHVVNDLIKRGNTKDTALEAAFNGNVLGDSEYTRAYLED